MLNHLPLDTLLDAVAEATRRNMVETLCVGPMRISDLAKRYDMTLSAVSQHIKVLVDSGMIECPRVGRVRTCRVKTEALEEIERWAAERRFQLQARLDRFARYLAPEGGPAQ